MKLIEKNISIVIVDDHQMVIDGIRAMLATSKEIEIIGQAHNGKEALDVVRILSPDVVLMDISMPEMDGIDAMKMILDQGGNTRILILSMLKERSMIKKAINSGATGYVLKNEGRDELIKAIKSVASGNKYLSQEIDLKSRKAQYDSDTPVISRREKQVLGLIVQELTAKEISEQLFISQHTVDAHRKNLLMKLEVRNTAGLVREAIKHKLA